MITSHYSGWWPVDLNFAIYVASAFHILPDESPFVSDGLWAAVDPPSIPESECLPLGQDWRQWWWQMVSDHAQNARAQDEAFFANDGRPSCTWQNQDFRSPYFAPNDRFQNLPRLLQSCCNTVFPSFQEWWTLPTGGMTEIRQRQHRVSMVQAMRDEKQGETANPKRMRLTVDYLYTGLGEIVTVTPSFVIMSVQHEPTMQNAQDWFVARIRALRRE